MTTWRKIRDTSQMNTTAPNRTQNLSSIYELAAWPDLWVLRGKHTQDRDALYGFDPQANRLIWSLKEIRRPSDMRLDWTHPPLLAQAGELAIAAAGAGDDVRLLALEPRTGALVWQKPVAWYEGNQADQIFPQPFIGIQATDKHVIVIENRDRQGKEPVLLWLDPASGETVHACPSPASRQPTVVAGDYLYLTQRWGKRKGLYRAPVVPSTPTVEHVEETRVASLMAHGDALYAICTQKDEATGDLLDWTVTRRDPHTLDVQSTHTYHWESDGFWPELMVVDPARPDHVVLIRGARLWGLDLASGTTLWAHDFPNTLNLRHVLRTPHGALLVDRDGVQGLDLKTGACSPTGMNAPLRDVVAAGDHVLTSSYWCGGGSTLYVAGGTSAAENAAVVTDDETWTTYSLDTLLPPAGEPAQKGEVSV
jgi:outer membrane protein assembly factor BamB